MTAAHLTERDSRILDAYFLGQRDLPALAAECGLSHDDLQAWLARPEIQAALEHLDRITAVTRRLRAFDDQMAALAALGDVCRHSPCLVERRHAAMAILRGRWMHPPRPRTARPARARPARSTPSAGRPRPARTLSTQTPSPPRVEVPSPPRVDIPAAPPAPPSALNPAIPLTNSPAPGAPQALSPRAPLAPPPEPAPAFLAVPGRETTPAATTQYSGAKPPPTKSPPTRSLSPHPRAAHRPRSPRPATAAARPLDSG